MKKAITRTAIAALPVSPPSSTKKPVWDVQVPGFGAYKLQSGQVTFVYQYRMPGAQTRSIKIATLGEMTIEQARAVAADLAQQRRRGEDPIDAMRNAAKEERAKTELVLAEYAAGFLQRRIDAGKPLNKVQTGIVNKDVVGHLGGLRIDRITVTDVETFAATLGERGVSARRMGLVYLKMVLNDARRRGMIQSSPADAVETPKSGERERRLSDREIRRFYESAHDVGGVRAEIYHVLLRTLKRKEEISRMLWEHLDLAKGVWNLPGPGNKGGKPHVIVLPKQVLAIIERQQADPKLRRGPVFTLDGGTTSPEMGSQVKDLLDANLDRRLELEAGGGLPLPFEHFTVHDLRTTGGSRMQEEPLRLPVDVINTVLLHVIGGKVTRTYMRSGLVEEAGEALQRWNDWLDELVDGEGGWFGGRDLPPIRGKEIAERVARLRADWPKRADQLRADERRKTGTARRRRGKAKGT